MLLVKAAIVGMPGLQFLLTDFFPDTPGIRARQADNSYAGAASCSSDSGNGISGQGSEFIHGN